MNQDANIQFSTVRHRLTNILGFYCLIRPNDLDTLLTHASPCWGRLVSNHTLRYHTLVDESSYLQRFQPLSQVMVAENPNFLPQTF